MISHAGRNPEEPRAVTPPHADDYIAPAPRVSVQAFCETEETAAAVRSAGEDRPLRTAHLSVQFGGVAAGLEAHPTPPTPHPIILENQRRRDILPRLAEL